MKKGKKTGLVHLHTKTFGVGVKAAPADSLFKRVVAILEEARANVVRSVNRNMVSAYWLIGQAIVEEIQRGEKRAEYGKRLLEGLSERLVARYGEGYSVTSLKYFRTFYISYADRAPKISRPTGDLLSKRQKGRPLGDQLVKAEKSFHPNLSWSHYRALMRVENAAARNFYEEESVRCGWDKRTLERQISTLFYERLLKSQNKKGMLKDAVSKNDTLQPIDVLKNPYILEFLNLPNDPRLGAGCT